MRVKVKNTFNAEKVKERAKRAKKWSLADATRYVWTVAKNSVRKGTSVKKEKIPLSFFDKNGRLLFKGKPTRNFTVGNSKAREERLRAYSRRLQRLNGKGRGTKAKVIRKIKKTLAASIKDLRREIRDEKKQRRATVNYLKERIGTRQRDYTFFRSLARPSTPGTAPRSWDHWSPYMNYYLKKRILYEAEAGRVYVEPGKSTADIWRRHERGGSYMVQNTYPVVILDPETGPRWEKRKVEQMVRFPKRPFMEPAAEKSQKYLPEIWAKSIRTAFN